jgi:hypothetical protein
MARTAKLSIDDVRHQHIVGAHTHFEADFGVTYRAVETYAMKPVWKDHWTHAGFSCSLVEYHVAILGTGGDRRKQHERR